MQAWLDAYHGVTSGQGGILVAGDLSGRAGSIQAAVNLEFHAMRITSIDIKVAYRSCYIFYCLLWLPSRCRILRVDLFSTLRELEMLSQK